MPIQMTLEFKTASELYGYTDVVVLFKEDGNPYAQTGDGDHYALNQAQKAIAVEYRESGGKGDYWQYCKRLKEAETPQK